MSSMGIRSIELVEPSVALSKRADHSVLSNIVIHCDFGMISM